MSDNYKATIYTPTTIVTIENGQVNLADPHNDSPTINDQEFAMLAHIAQCLAALRNGKLIDYSLNGKSFENDDELIKCEWLRSGNLKIHGPTKKIYCYVENKTDAVRGIGVFTCKRKLVSELPRNRSSV